MTAIDVELGGCASLVAVFLFLTTLSTALRFVARFKAKSRILLDDYCVVLSWIGFVGIAAAFIYGMRIHFFGYPEPKSVALVNATHPHIELATTAINFLDAFALGTNKLSALFFYRRVFCTRKDKRAFFDYLSVGFIAIIVAWIITFCIMPFNVCGSHSTIHWGIEPGHIAHCKLTFPYLLGLSISDFILDVLIVTIVLPLIWQLSMQTPRKFAITGIFLVALAGVGASCARMVIYIENIELKRALDNADGYQINTKASYYAVLEVGLSLVCVNLPSLHFWFSGSVQPEKVAQSNLHSRGSGRSGSEQGITGSDSALGSSTVENAGGKAEPQVLERAKSEV